MFKLARQENCDEKFVDRTLDGDHGDETENSMRSIPQFKEPLHKTSVLE